MKTVVITRRIELRFNSTNDWDRKKFYKEIKNWQKICFKGANQIVSQLFFILNQGDLTWINEKAKKIIEDENFFKDMTEEERKAFFKNENKEIGKIVAEKEIEMVVGSFQNAFYQVLSRRYLTECPSAVLTSLNQRVFKTFTENRFEYLAGNKSIPSYRNKMPIPIQGGNIVQVRRHVQEGKTTKDFAFTLFKHPLRTNFGIDRSNNAYIMKEAFSSFFLPSWIWDMEAQLSGILENLDTLTYTFEIGNRKFYAEAKTEKKKILYYQMKAWEEDNEIAFRMRPAKQTQKNEKGEKILNDMGKPVKKEIFKIISNIRLLDSSIMLKDDQFQDQKSGEKKDITRIFLLATLEFEKEKYLLDENEVCTAFLSPEQPVTINHNNKEFKIGSKDDFTYRRTGIEGARRQMQRDLKGVKGGKGRRKKLKTLDQYKEYESNVVKEKLHKYSRQLIKYCLDNQCKYLHLHLYKLSAEELKIKDLILRYWSPSLLISYIKYKASLVGIDVIEDSAEDH